jgi:serpin B
LLRRAYDARVTTLRLGDPLAAAEINAWVVEQTRGRIDRLFDSLPAGASLVLANAVYLRATWLRQFNPAMTVSGAFRRVGGSPVEGQLMRQIVDGVRYAETADWQRVTLPYAGGVLAMRVVVPRAVVDDVRALAALLPAAARAETGDPSGWVDLTLPRWESHVDLSLVRPLAALGMTDVFDARAADLSGIAPGLSVSDAIHRATITVDEEGTEAAAVTGVAMRLSMRAGEPVEMRVDRPFVWAIVHEPTGTPMFLGHVVDPAPPSAPVDHGPAAPRS